jgi:predicted amidohydrolase
MKARAMENLAYTVGTNRVGTDGNDMDYIGHSMVVGPDGEVIFDAGTDMGGNTVTISKDHLDEYRKNFPAHLDADPFLLSSSLED